MTKCFDIANFLSKYFYHLHITKRSCTKVVEKEFIIQMIRALGYETIDTHDKIQQTL